jgi:membrane protease YdiL (CAAX protease family)
MKELNRAAVFYIITSLLCAALLFPAFFQPPGENPLLFNEENIRQSIIKGIPFLLLLLFLSLYGSAEERTQRGWKKPSRGEILMIPALFGATTAFSLGFPASDGSFSVELRGFTGGLLILLFSLITAFSEELFFRSWLISGMKKLSLPRWSVFSLPVLFFASLHIWQGRGGFFFSLFSGSLYALYFMRRQSLIPIVFSHAVHNSLALLIMSGR